MNDEGELHQRRGGSVASSSGGANGFPQAPHTNANMPVPAYNMQQEQQSNQFFANPPAGNDSQQGFPQQQLQQQQQQQQQGQQFGGMWGATNQQSQPQGAAGFGNQRVFQNINQKAPSGNRGMTIARICLLIVLVIFMGGFFYYLFSGSKAPTIPTNPVKEKLKETATERNHYKEWEEAHKQHHDFQLGSGVVHDNTPEQVQHDIPPTNAEEKIEIESHKVETPEIAEIEQADQVEEENKEENVPPVKEKTMQVLVNPYHQLASKEMIFALSDHIAAYQNKEIKDPAPTASTLIHFSSHMDFEVPTILHRLNHWKVALKQITSRNYLAPLVFLGLIKRIVWVYPDWGVNGFSVAKDIHFKIGNIIGTERLAVDNIDLVKAAPGFVTFATSEELENVQEGILRVVPLSMALKPFANREEVSAADFKKSLGLPEDTGSGRNQIFLNIDNAFFGSKNPSSDFLRKFHDKYKNELAIEHIGSLLSYDTYCFQPQLPGAREGINGLRLLYRHTERLIRGKWKSRDTKDIRRMIHYSMEVLNPHICPGKTKDVEMGLNELRTFLLSKRKPTSNPLLLIHEFKQYANYMPKKTELRSLVDDFEKFLKYMFNSGKDKPYSTHINLSVFQGLLSFKRAHTITKHLQRVFTMFDKHYNLDIGQPEIDEDIHYLDILSQEELKQFHDGDLNFIRRVPDDIIDQEIKELGLSPAELEQINPSKKKKKKKSSKQFITEEDLKDDDEDEKYDIHQPHESEYQFVDDTDQPTGYNAKTHENEAEVNHFHADETDRDKIDHDDDDFYHGDDFHLHDDDLENEYQEFLKEHPKKQKKPKKASKKKKKKPKKKVSKKKKKKKSTKYDDEDIEDLLDDDYDYDMLGPGHRY